MSGSPNARVALGLLMLISASLACNAQLGNSEPTAVAQGPSVVFIAPENNSTIAEGTSLTFAVNASGANVAKIDFLVDDSPIGTQTAPTAGGQSNFTAQQVWTASPVQGHLVVAIASDADGKTIGDAKLTIQVVAKPQAGQDTAATVPATKSPATTAALPTKAAPTPLIATNPPPQPTTAVPPTVAPTAAPAGQIILTVKSPNLNIRNGDGTSFSIIASMKTGDTAQIVGRNAARTWWVVQKDTVRGWVIASTEFSQVAGDTTNVPLAQSPATPVPSSNPPTAVPAQAATSTTGAVADLVIDAATLNPATPNSNQTFIVIITIRNQGSVDAPATTAWGAFQPGNEQSQEAVPAIKAGQSVSVNMAVTLKSGGANQSGVLTLDKYNQVDEGPNGEANNQKTISYNVN
ncbi:MAG: CARDB domain-containing protein [Chloroflexota bacterium]